MNEQEEFEFRLRFEQEQATEQQQSEQAPKDRTVMPTLGAGMVGAVASGVAEEGIAPVAMGVADELTGGAIQNPRSFAKAGLVGSNFAAGEDLLSMFTGTQDRDKGLYTPKTLGGNVAMMASGMATGAGVNSLIDALSKAPRGAQLAIKNTSGLIDQLMGEIDNTKGVLSAEQLRVNRAEGTAETFLKQSLNATDEQAKISKANILSEADQTQQIVREKAVDLSRKVRDKAIVYSQKIGEEFNADYTKALKGKKVSEDDAYGILYDTVKEAGMLNEETYNPSKWSTAQNSVYAIYEKYAKMANEANDLRSAGKARNPIQLDLKDLDDEIRNAVGAFRGKQWGSGEHILTDLRKNAMARLPQYGDARVISSKHAPKFKLRNAIFDRTKPFDKTGEASKSIDTFAQSLTEAASGRMNKKLNEFDTIKDIREAIQLDEFDDLFKTGDMFQQQKASVSSIDQLAQAKKLQQQKDVDTFIAKSKSQLEQFANQKNSLLEMKTKELEKSKALFDSLMAKENKAKDIISKMMGTAAAAAGGTAVYGIGKAVLKD